MMNSAVLETTLKTWYDSEIFNLEFNDSDILW